MTSYEQFKVDVERALRGFFLYLLVLAVFGGGFAAYVVLVDPTF